MPTQKKAGGKSPAKKTAPVKTKTKKPAAKKTTPKKTVPKQRQTRKEDTELFRKIEGSLREVSEDASTFATEIADKTSKFAEEIYDKVKKGVSGAYDVSAVVLDDIYQSAEKYADKYKNKIEMRRLNSERDDLAKQLGAMVYLRFRSKKPFDTQFIRDKKLTGLIAKIEKLDTEIVKKGRKLDQK